MRCGKISNTNSIAFATTVILIICSSVFLLNNSVVSYGQTSLLDQQQMPSMGVKITSPSKDEQIQIGNKNNFEFTGISTDNTNTNCKVSVILNSVKPYQEAVPTGPGGKEDYSTWSFVLTPSYNATIKEGTNKLTSKLSCTNSNETSTLTSTLAKHYSVFFDGVISISSNSSVAGSPVTNSVSIEQEKIRQQQQSAIATAPLQEIDSTTPAVLPAPSNENDKDIDKSKIASTSSSNVSRSIARTMTFTIYEEGKLAGTAKEPTIRSNDVATAAPAPLQGVVSSANTCNKNLPISRFYSIEDSREEDPTPPENAFDNSLSTRWSYDSIDTWIILDLGYANSNVCSVDIAWYRGDERTYDFVISISNDRTNFKDVYTGTSSGDTLSTERYRLIDTTASSSEGAVMARYVRITVNGNSDSDPDQNQWSAITEINVNGRNSYGLNVSSNNKINSSQLSSSGGGNNMIMKISGSYEQSNIDNNNNNNQRPPKIDPNRLEGTFSIIDSTTNKKVQEYDLAPINITFTQLFKKITIKAEIDDPIKNGTLISTLKFSSPIDFQNEGNYTGESMPNKSTTTATTTAIGGEARSMLLVKLSGGQTYSTRDDIKATIMIRPSP